MILGFDPVFGGPTGNFPVEGPSINAYSLEDAEAKFNEMEIPYMTIARVNV